MAITTLDGMISGLQNPIDFVKGLTGTMVAGTPVDLNIVPVASLASWHLSIYIGGFTPGATTDVYTYGGAVHPFSMGQSISITSASSTGPHECDGIATITAVASNYYTINKSTSTNPGSGGFSCCRAIGSPGLAGIEGSSLTSWGPSLSFNNPASGNTYLARLQGQAGVAGTLLLCDRLQHLCGINAYRGYTEPFVSPARIPSRDMNGTNNGHGVLAALEVVNANGAGGSAWTAILTYTNQSGDTGKTASLLFSPSSTPSHGAFFPIGLADGDTGIRQVESLQVSQWDSLSGGTDARTLSLVLYRVLARLPLLANARAAIDALTGCFPRLFDNTVPFLVFVPQTTTSSYVMGHVQYSQG